MRQLRIDERVLLMSESYATPLPHQAPLPASRLRADAQPVTLALCNRCGRPADGHPHAEPDE